MQCCPKRMGRSALSLQSRCMYTVCMVWTQTEAAPLPRDATPQRSGWACCLTTSPHQWVACNLAHASCQLPQMEYTANGYYFGVITNWKKLSLWGICTTCAPFSCQSMPILLTMTDGASLRRLKIWGFLVWRSQDRLWEQHLFLRSYQQL